jgi:hypothetical protein
MGSLKSDLGSSWDDGTTQYLKALRQAVEAAWETEYQETSQGFYDRVYVPLRKMRKLIETREEENVAANA